MSNNLPTSELDFDAVKEELITFLNGQEAFKDYDFTGSALNTLIDVCAYLIHYVGVQSNFALRESFLESAQLRKNVSAIAKEIGYFPSQAKAGRASFSLSLDVTDVGVTTSVTVPKGTIFAAKLETGETVQFVTYNDNPLVDTGITAGLAASGTLVGTVYVAQGVFNRKTWIVTDTNDQYSLDHANIDTDFLTISVYPNSDSDTVAVWEYGDNITEVGPQTQAYFLREEQETVAVYFGNNTIGQALTVDNYVIAEFLVTEGAVSNGIRQFSIVGNIEGYQPTDFAFVDGSVETTTDAADRESVTSIKFLAPLSYQRQHRIVTIEDYKTAILERYSNVKAINAWGGEDAEPPEFGKVFVSIAPVYGDTVSPTTKKSIEEDVLQKFSVVGVSPELVDPEYLLIGLSSTVTYNKDKTTTKAAELISTVQEAIDAFFAEQVFDYNQSFKYSKCLAAIDAAHPAITHSLAEVTIGKKFTAANVAGSYELKFYNELQPGTIASLAWVNTGGNLVSLRDDYNGNVDQYVNGQLSTKKVGTINYTTGLMNINGFNANMQTPGAITVQATPTSLDVNIRYNSLAQLADNDVAVVVEVRS